MSRIFEKGWGTRLLLAITVITGALAICGALPGEVNGCDTDLSNEVNHIEYCQNRCAVICERVVECGRYQTDIEPAEGETPEEVCQAECEEHYLCSNVQLCPSVGDMIFEDPYISENEAETCLADWRGLSCTILEEGTPLCGRDFGQCPIIETCTGEVLCDPPEWE
jgi:hypothetical protein